MKKLSDIDFSGKRVFLRADLDVPLGDGDQEVATRLKNLRPTVDYLFEKGVTRIVIAGHIGRPVGRDLNFSCEKIKYNLETILGRSIAFMHDFTKEPIVNVTLFENLRFWPGEVANDMEFAKELSTLAEVYVNEAFGNCHRKHASIVALPSLLPHAAGLHLAEEVRVLSAIMNAPQRPFVAIVGGAKLETKIPLIESLSKIADYVMVGGVLPLEIAERKIDFSKNVIVAKLEGNTKDIKDGDANDFCEKIKGAKTIVWNGPMGLFEEGFDKGTEAVANAISQSGSYSVVGGGETTGYLASKGLIGKYSFVSSGGGAMLEFLSGKQLPGIAALD